MSYLRYMCLFTYSDVQHNVFLFCLSLYCVPNVASFSGLFIFDCPFVRHSLTFCLGGQYIPCFTRKILMPRIILFMKIQAWSEVYQEREVFIV